MRKTLKSILAVSLCVCMVLSAGITGIAASNNSTKQVQAVQSYASIEEYIAQSNAGGTAVAAAKTAAAVNNEADPEEPAEKSIASKPVGQTTLGDIIAKVVNFFSDILINRGVLGALKAVLPQSPAIPDYESFDLDAYDDFYAGLKHS